MAEQAQALREAVAVFKIDDTAGHSNSAHAPLVAAPRVVMPSRTPDKTPTQAIAARPA